VSDRRARVLLGLIAAALVAAALFSDLAKLSGGRFWGDGATYYAMAWSLAEDGDLRYEAKDPIRVRREFAGGAQGIFLKRAAGGLRVDREAGFPWLSRVPEGEPRIYFAKPFSYPLAAAPLVRLFGTRGLLLTNALALALALILGYLELRRQAGPGPALMASTSLFLLTITPVYLFWPTPEAMSVGLIAAALFAWRRGWASLSAVLFGIATYSKPPNLLLAAPLGLAPLLEGGGPLARRCLETLRRGAILALAALALYGANRAITGEWNYQGGRERKTFYGTLPLEQYGVTFGNSGIWMSTNQVGPRVEGKDDVTPSQGAEPPRTAAELRTSFLWNLWYFWSGRFGGVVPYFLPFAGALAAFLLLGPRSASGSAALAGFVFSYLFYIWQIPDNWYGGSGTLGNRYFLNILPLAIYFVPKGREWLVGLCGLASAAVLALVFAAPIHHALCPGEHAKSAPIRAFPAELTMLNDLSIFGETWRKKQSVGVTDPKPPTKADPSAYYLYFMDDGSYGREEKDGAVGFWLRGGAPGEVIVRALEPIRVMTVRVTGGPLGDEVRLATGGASQTVSVAARETREIVFRPPRGFPYKDTFVHVLETRSRRGGVVSGPSGDARLLGAFVQITLEVVPREPR
jgi:hypothetical protein